jgi:excinuclease ABC subunit A
MVDAVLALPEETKLMILAPVIGRKGEHADLFEELRPRASCACASMAWS